MADGRRIDIEAIDEAAEFRDIMVGMAAFSRDLNASAQLQVLGYTDLYDPADWRSLDHEEILLETAQRYDLDWEGVKEAFNICVDAIHRLPTQQL